MSAAEGLVRAAESLLRGAGRRVMLRLPQVAAGGDEAEELGLGASGFRDVEVGDCVFRKAGSRRELLVPAEAVTRLVGSPEPGSAAKLFGEAAGVVVGDELLLIEGLMPVVVGASVVLYRVLLRV